MVKVNLVEVRRKGVEMMIFGLRLQTFHYQISSQNYDTDMKSVCLMNGRRSEFDLLQSNNERVDDDGTHMSYEVRSSKGSSQYLLNFEHIGCCVSEGK